MEPGLLIFLSLVGFAGFGVLWFYVLEPALTGLGVLRPAADDTETVNYSATTAPVVMSNDGTPHPDVLPVVPTDGRASDAGRTEPQPSYTQQQLLTHYQWLRRLGAKRDEARPYLRAMGIPLHNDLWAQAAPLPPQAVSPIAGRPIDPALFHADAPDLRYRPLGEE